MSLLLHLIRQILEASHTWQERSLRKRTRIYCIAETSFWQDWEATIRTALKDDNGGRTRQEQDNRREIGHRQAHG